MRPRAILAALPYVLDKQAEEDVYKLYITDSLYYGFQGKVLGKRYAEIIKGKAHKEDTKTGDDIAADIINRMGLKL